MCTVSRLPLETVAVQQRQEDVKVLVFPVVRCGR
jgi:hypothetical protein